MGSLYLPPDAATQVYACVGRRGSGKSYGWGTWVESFLDAGTQVVMVDPVGNWWGLQVSADGTTPSPFAHRVPIIGGPRSNVPDPVRVRDGAAVGRALAATGSSAVVDVSMMRPRSMRLWLAAFFEEFYEAKKQDPGPVLVAIEEAHKVAPQRPAPGSDVLLEAVEQLPLVGRNFGIGLALLGPRPQLINKDLLSAVEVWMLFQQVGPHERKFLEALLDTKQTNKRTSRIGRMMPELGRGECILYSPSWLRVMRKLKLGRKRTYDSTATPAGRPRKIAMPAIEIAPSLLAALAPTPRQNKPIEFSDGAALASFLEDTIADDQVEAAIKALRRRRRLQLV